MNISALYTWKGTDSTFSPFMPSIPFINGNRKLLSWMSKNSSPCFFSCSLLGLKDWGAMVFKFWVKTDPTFRKPVSRLSVVGQTMPTMYGQGPTTLLLKSQPTKPTNIITTTTTPLLALQQLSTHKRLSRDPFLLWKTTPRKVSRVSSIYIGLKSYYERPVIWIMS